MLLLRCTDSLSGVGKGYTCVVDTRSLRHIASASQMNNLVAVGIPARNLNAVAFYEVLNGLGIPRAAVKKNADWTRG
ncbi:hypothetical protein FRIG_01225 [Frigoribacterium faeni]|uniref:hypothetical protein n=1 Tax=Frigoribacterium TaxID=96492 RepID=UPI001FAD1202|nr:MULTISPECIES: hypothetical protein [Frigoribacterium]MCJ0699760.1 hypothetical protein [Frigoribacterium faeni]MDY0891233.1 hypothetical protein [Frigoribacterium sp. CFBP9030]